MEVWWLGLSTVGKEAWTTVCYISHGSGSREQDINWIWGWPPTHNHNLNDLRYSTNQVSPLEGSGCHPTPMSQQFRGNVWKHRSPWGYFISKALQAFVLLSQKIHVEIVMCKLKKSGLCISTEEWLLQTHAQCRMGERSCISAGWGSVPASVQSSGCHRCVLGAGWRALKFLVEAVGYKVILCHPTR